MYTVSYRSIENSVETEPFLYVKTSSFNSLFLITGELSSVSLKGVDMFLFSQMKVIKRLESGFDSALPVGKEEKQIIPLDKWKHTSADSLRELTLKKR